MTPTNDGQLLLDTNGSNYHTVVQVYTGRPGALIAMACSSEALPGTVVAEFSPDFELATDELAGILVALKKGTTYYIEVGDATEPELEEKDFNFIIDPKTVPNGGLLQVNATFITGGRGRAVRR
jgi:hypothetical protein